MKAAVKYLNDSSGKIKIVQLPLTEWKKVLAKIQKYEQVLKIKSDLKEAYYEVKNLSKTKAKKQTLREFIN
jgi:hypothetical protein